MPIKWDIRLSVGNINIDTEHKLLLSQLNALELIARHPEEKEALAFFFEQFHVSAKEHFDHEEQMQIRCMYPFYDENKEGHDSILEQLAATKIDLDRYLAKPVNNAEETKAICEKIDFIIRNWFVDHIVKSDLKMKGFMDQMGRRVGEKA
jgi:hemerythrin